MNVICINKKDSTFSPRVLLPYFKTKKVNFEIIELEEETVCHQVNLYARKKDLQAVTLSDSFDDLILEYLSSTMIKGEKNVLMAHKDLMIGGLKLIRPLILCPQKLLEKHAKG